MLSLTSRSESSKGWTLTSCQVIEFWHPCLGIHPFLYIMFHSLQWHAATLNYKISKLFEWESFLQCMIYNTQVWEWYSHARSALHKTGYVTPPERSCMFHQHCREGRWTLKRFFATFVFCNVDMSCHTLDGSQDLSGVLDCQDFHVAKIT